MKRYFASGKVAFSFIKDKAGFLFKERESVNMNIYNNKFK